MSDLVGNTDGLSVRRLASTALCEVLEGKRFLDEVLSTLSGVEDLSSRDRAFLHAIILNSLRHLGEIEAVLGEFLTRPLPRKSGVVRWVLIVSTAQLLYMGVAPHAVINLAVRIARQDSHGLHFSGLVNAVLRRVTVDGQAALSKLESPGLNTPSWLWKRWCSAYGSAVAAGIAAAHGSEPGLDLSVASDGIGWAERLGGTLLPGGSIRLPAAHAPVEQLPGFSQGGWWVQDAAAAIPARLFTAVQGKSVLDLCAAPGGKTMQLCAAGAKVTAVDHSPQRMERLRENLVRQGFTAQLVLSDASDLSVCSGFDCVLLDAPCSATGTLRRHPELAWIKDVGSIYSLAIAQRKLLLAAARYVRPGGELVYCTCSLEQEEGEEQVSGFLRTHRNFRVNPIMLACEGVEEDMITPQGFLRTLPCMTAGASQGMDGFFAARFTRVS